MITGLDIELQTYGEKLMQGKVGSIIAIEPRTGEIIAYVSSPGYDPNLLTGRYRRHNFNILYKDEHLPLYNRPIQAMYPPGSTFKAPAAMVMLQEQTHAWNWPWFCHGGYRVGSHVVNCHGSHAIPDVQTALQYSCNSYFCKIYNDFIMDSVIGNPENAYRKWWGLMAKFGYGKKLGIDLANEKKGNLPTADYYNKVFGKGKWKASTIISNSIGQGEVLATPLQICNTMAIIANKGYYYTPKVCRSISKDKEKLYPKKQKTTIPFNAAYWDMVIDGLERVVLAGTARVAQIPNISFCGKTGTAQNPHGKDHSIFAGFAPKDNPKIAIAVFVENAGFGATYAAPIASLMVEKYLNDTISAKRVPLQERMINIHLIQYGHPDSIKVQKAKADSIKQAQVKKDSLQKIKLQQEALKNKNNPGVMPADKPKPMDIE
jgi:penicillin-binding protein 2